MTRNHRGNKAGGRPVGQRLGGLKSGGRLGVKASSVNDARFAIINKKRSTIVDARDKLAEIARGTDAREKLKKIRNLKEGKLEVKKTSGGKITITKKTNGSLQLTTARKQIKKDNPKQKSPPKKSGSSDSKKRRRSRTPERRNNGDNKKRSDDRNEREDRRLTYASTVNNTILTPRPDPFLVDPYRSRFEQPVLSQHRPQSNHYRPNFDLPQPRPAASMISYDDRRYSPPRTSNARFDYLPSRSEAEEVRQRMLMLQELEALHPSRARAHEPVASYSSPLQGTKMIVTNLEPSVIQEDIVELFGEVGPLKRAKMIGAGVAEVVFVNNSHAQQAVDIYHNRQLDGKPMKCIIETSSSYPDRGIVDLQRVNASSRDPPQPDMNVVHRALFDRKRPQSSNRTNFSVTVSKRGGRY